RKVGGGGAIPIVDGYNCFLLIPQPPGHVGPHSSDSYEADSRMRLSHHACASVRVSMRASVAYLLKVDEEGTKEFCACINPSWVIMWTSMAIGWPISTAATVSTCVTSHR